MPYKRTGRPPGRPKTKEYVTLSARVPQDTADQVGRYAKRHRQTLSEVMRDGFTLLLQEDRYAPFVADTNGTPENVSDSIPTAPDILSDTNGTPLAQENVSDMNGAPEILSDTLHMQRLREIVSDTIPTETVPEIVSDTNGVSEIVSDTNTSIPLVPLDTADLGAMPREPVAIAPQPVLDFDPHKYMLGSPCKAAGHLSHGDKGNLRVLVGGACVACDVEKKATKAKAAQRSRPLESEQVSPPPVPLAAEDVEEMPLEPAPPPVDIPQQPLPPALDYDQAKYVLGRLCPRGHDYQDTGQSLLRRTNRHCGACDREKFHERKQAKRHAAPVA